MAPNRNESEELVAKIGVEQDHNEFTALVQELNRLLDAEQPVEKPPKADHLTMHSAKI